MCEQHLTKLLVFEVRVGRRRNALAVGQLLDTNFFNIILVVNSLILWFDQNPVELHLLGSHPVFKQSEPLFIWCLPSDEDLECFSHTCSIPWNPHTNFHPDMIATILQMSFVNSAYSSLRTPIRFRAARC